MNMLCILVHLRIPGIMYLTHGTLPIGNILYSDFEHSA